MKKLKMDNCKPINTPLNVDSSYQSMIKEKKVDPTFFKSLVESLRYLTCTRSDVLYVVGLVSRYIVAQTNTHLKTAKRIFRYIKGTINFS